MDFVFTVCDQAAGEASRCGQGSPSPRTGGPAAVEGRDIEKELAFEQAFRFLRNRIGAFVALPLQSIGRMVLGTRLKEIGAMDGSTVSRGTAA